MSEREPIPKSDAFVRCYGCGPENAHGLQLDFELDRAAKRVIAPWTGEARFAGYRNIIHGGVVATMLDEGMGWALWGLRERVGMTRSIQVSYERPVFVGRDYRVEAWIERSDEEEATVCARVLDRRDRVSAEARGEWVYVRASKAGDAPARPDR